MRIAVTILVVLSVVTGMHAQSTGYPKCDEYVRMVSECIATRVPEDERDEERETLEQFKTTLQNPMLGAMVARACEQNIQEEVQRDQFGCYADRAASAGIPTACTLLTPTDLQEVLAAPFADGLPGNSSCSFESTRRRLQVVSVQVHWKDGQEQMDAWRAGVAMAVRETGKASPRSAVSADTLSGIADDAYFVSAGFQPILAARRGDIAVVIEAQGTREQLTALMSKALSRLR